MSHGRQRCATASCEAWTQCVTVCRGVTWRGMIWHNVAWCVTLWHDELWWTMMCFSHMWSFDTVSHGGQQCVIASCDALTAGVSWSTKMCHSLMWVLTQCVMVNNDVTDSWSFDTVCHEGQRWATGSCEALTVCHGGQRCATASSKALTQCVIMDNDVSQPHVKLDTLCHDGNNVPQPRVKFWHSVSWWTTMCHSLVWSFDTVSHGGQRCATASCEALTQCVVVFNGSCRLTSVQFQKNSEMCCVWVRINNLTMAPTRHISELKYAPTQGTFSSFLEIDKTAGAYSLKIYDYLSQIQRMTKAFLLIVRHNTEELPISDWQWRRRMLFFFVGSQNRVNLVFYSLNHGANWTRGTHLKCAHHQRTAESALS